MKKSKGIWLPDSDTHVFGDGYQKDAYDKAKSYVKDWDLALDVGAHVGIFTRYMLQDFSRVISWEPVDENRACLWRNNPEGDLAVRATALGDEHRLVKMTNPAPGNTGAWEAVMSGGAMDNLIPVSVLDDEDLSPCGLIKIDCQGMDEKVIIGGMNYLLKSKPVIIVEDNITVLAPWGFKHVATSGKNKIWVWRDQ